MPRLHADVAEKVPQLQHTLLMHRLYYLQLEKRTDLHRDMYITELRQTVEIWRNVWSVEGGGRTGPNKTELSDLFAGMIDVRLLAPSPSEAGSAWMIM